MRNKYYKVKMDLKINNNTAAISCPGNEKLYTMRLRPQVNELFTTIT